MAKKKKNFKGLTGIKFSDLIMPLVLGGVGSYSPAAGRGVNLGLQAFRTLQSGREYQDERDLSKSMVENFENTAKMYQDERNTIQQGITREDPTMTSAKGYYKEEGAILPDPEEEWEKGDPLVKEGKKSFIDQMKARSGELEGDRFDISAGVAAMSDAGAEKNAMDVINEQQGLTGEQAQVSPQFEGMRMQQQEMIPQEAMDFTQRILERKMAGQDSAKRLGFIDKQVRFYEQMAALGAVNPSSAGYLAGMNELQRMSEESTMDQMFVNHEANTTSRREKHENAMIQILFRHDKAMARQMQKQKVQKYSPMMGKDGVIYSMNKETGEWIDKTGSANEKVKTLSWEEKRKFFNDAHKQFFDLVAGPEMGRFAKSNPDYQNMLAKARDRYVHAQKIVTDTDWEQFVAEYYQREGTMPPAMPNGRPSGPAPGDPEIEAAAERVAGGW